MLLGHVSFSLLVFLALLCFLSCTNATTCSVTVSEYSSSGCSAANLVGCNRYTDLNESSCTAITSSINSSNILYLQFSNCSSGFSVHRDSDCSDTIDANNGLVDSCSTVAPYFSFDIYSIDATPPYCAQPATISCPFTVISYNDLLCSTFLQCTVSQGNKDGVCVYEQQLGLYLLPLCQTGDLIISSQATCSGGLTHSFHNISVPADLINPTCSPFGNNDTTFAVYFNDDLDCGSATGLLSWLHHAFSLFFSLF